MKRTAAIPQALAALDALHLRRSRRTVQIYSAADRITHTMVNGATLLNFCSNDYLGLARDPRLVRAMQESAAAWGAGAGAAHLVSGHTREHQLLEEELAAFTGREAALLFSTGYMANLGVITAFAARGEVVVQDRLNHASLLDGARLSAARLLRYRHADADDAAQVLQTAAGKATLLATDAVFSMDGDVAPLPALATLAREHDAWLLVDDAHGLGVLGANGRGALEAADLDEQAVPLLMGTLGKALGSFGAFVAGPREVIELLLQRARSYIYTTALPPAVAAATRAALRVITTDSAPREQLWARIHRFRHGATQRGLPLLPSVSAIQPISVHGAARCLAASHALAQRGFWVSAIRSPTVPRGSERLRVTLSAAHTKDEVDRLLDALQICLRELPAE
jgi:8-amino-7-oxononanoate synthase